jgi:hypothetical protein
VVGHQGEAVAALHLVLATRLLADAEDLDVVLLKGGAYTECPWGKKYLLPSSTPSRRVSPRLAKKPSMVEPSGSPSASS